MDLENAIKMLTSEYERAKTLKYVSKPLAYALYRVWRMVDKEPARVVFCRGCSYDCNARQREKMIKDCLKYGQGGVPDAD